MACFTCILMTVVDYTHNIDKYNEHESLILWT